MLSVFGMIPAMREVCLLSIVQSTAVIPHRNDSSTPCLGKGLNLKKNGYGRLLVEHDPMHATGCGI